MTTATVSGTSARPNVLSSSFTLDTGTVVTMFRAVPGDTTPRMQMQMPGCQPIDCGAIEAPERFGSYGTNAEFQAWSQRFAESA